MATTRPSQIPVPDSASPRVGSGPPSPSAFPSLVPSTSSSSSSADAHPPSPFPTSTSNYALATGKVLPPSSIPKGVSLPPPPHPDPTSTSTATATATSASRERHSNRRDSPYARPPNSRGNSHSKSTPAADQQQHRKKPATKHVKVQPRPAAAAAAALGDPDDSVKQYPRTVPGMPPTWIAKNKKSSPAASGGHARRKSEGATAAPKFALPVVEQPDSSSRDSNSNSMSNSNDKRPAGPEDFGKPGKKKRQTLRKTLAPSTSKLSALAPSFEFVPRSQTLPNLASYSQTANGGESHDDDEDHHQEDRDDPSPLGSRSASSTSLASFLPSAFSLSSPPSPLASGSPGSNDDDQQDPAEGLVDERLAAETVSSSGPQADGFVGQSFEQSESGAKPNADVAGFGAIPGAVDESPVADLVWKDKMGWWREDYDPEEVQRDEDAQMGDDEDEDKGEQPPLAPAAVEPASTDETLYSFPPWTPPRTSSQESHDDKVEADVESSTVSPSLLADVLPTSFSSPPSPPPSVPVHQDSLSFSPKSTDPSPAKAEVADSSSESIPSEPASKPEASQPPASSSSSSSSSASPPSPGSTTPSLSSYLPNSFTPSLESLSSSTSFLSTDELRAEALAHDHDDDDPLKESNSATGSSSSASNEMPLTVEQVAAEPSLDDVLDVDELPTNGRGERGNVKVDEKEVREQKEDEAKVETKKKGWWNADDDDDNHEDEEKDKLSNVDSAGPMPGQAERDLVDPELAKETVESVPAQADGFVAKGYEESDKVGVEADVGEKEVKKGVKVAVEHDEGRNDVVEEGGGSQEANEDVDGSHEANGGTSTPLGSFLHSAFQPGESFSSVSRTSDAPSSSSPRDAASTEPISSPSSEKTTTPAVVSSATQPSDSTSTSTSSIPVPPPAGLGRRRSSSSPPPPERQPSESHSADNAPSLTLAISSAWHTAPWSRKLWAIVASVAINVGLPFVNGVMLGFGELFARNVLGVRFGWPLHNSTSTTSSSSRANTSGVGLRSAGAYNNPSHAAATMNGGRGVGTDVPGHAGAKTALEGVVETVAEQ